MDLLNLTQSSFTYSDAVGILQPFVIYLGGMVVYAVFIFKFYRFLARKNVLKLNLSEYNDFSHPILHKGFALVLYFLEYIFIFPILIFFWFIILSVFIALLSSSEASNILMISMALVAATRITAFYNEDLARDVAKTIPFALLGIFVTDIGAFSFSKSLDVIMQFPGMLKMIGYYLALTVVLELYLRIISGISSMIKSNSDDKEDDSGDDADEGEVDEPELQ